MIEEALAIQLVATEPVMEGQYAEFDYGAMLAGDPVKQTDTLVKAVGGPFMTPNEARALRNLAPKDDPEADQLRPAPNASLKDEPRGDS
jgi:phage portal protein BeeE